MSFGFLFRCDFFLRLLSSPPLLLLVVWKVCVVHILHRCVYHSRYTHIIHVLRFCFHLHISSRAWMCAFCTHNVPPLCTIHSSRYLLFLFHCSLPYMCFFYYSDYCMPFNGNTITVDRVMNGYIVYILAITEWFRFGVSPLARIYNIVQWLFVYACKLFKIHFSRLHFFCVHCGKQRKKKLPFIFSLSA